MKKLITIILAMALILPVVSIADSGDLYAASFETGETKTYILDILKTQEKIYVLGFEFDLNDNGFPYKEENGEIKLEMSDGEHNIHIDDGELSYQLTPTETNVVTLPVVRKKEEKINEASSDINLSGMSYDDLVSLRNKINLAMWNSSEWQEVTIPAGVWEVGKDIPEGHWTIRNGVENQLINIVYTDILDEYGKDVTWGWKGWQGSLCNKKNKDGSDKWPEYPREADIDMKAGMYFINKEPVIFTPYTGKPDLGFK